MVVRTNKLVAYLGIDPSAIGNGSGGGSCVLLTPDGKAESIDLNKGEQLVACKIREWSRTYLVRACLEQVHSMPQQGVSSTFKFGTGYGYCMGVLNAFAIPYKLVTPQAWQKHFAISKQDKSLTHAQKKAARKKEMKALAEKRKLLPKVTLINADAVLLAIYLKETGI
jgi:hypothetical protein